MLYLFLKLRTNLEWIVGAFVVLGAVPLLQYVLLLVVELLCLFWCSPFANLYNITSGLAQLIDCNRFGL